MPRKPLPSAATPASPGKRVPREESQGGRAVVEAEGNPVALLLLDRPPKIRTVEVFRPVHVFDPKRDDAYVLPGRG